MSDRRKVLELFEPEGILNQEAILIWQFKVVIVYAFLWTLKRRHLHYYFLILSIWMELYKKNY